MAGTQIFQFPVKGVNRAFSRSTQPDMTAYDMLNVLPFDRVGRLRGGKRPGTVKQYPDPLAEHQNVQMIASVQATTGGQTVVPDELIFNDGFNYENGALFTVSSQVWFNARIHSAGTFPTTTRPAGILGSTGGSLTELAVDDGAVVRTGGSGSNSHSCAIYQPALTVGTAYVVQVLVEAADAGSSNHPLYLHARVSVSGLGESATQTAVTLMFRPDRIAVFDALTQDLDNPATFHDFAERLPPGTYTVEMRVNGDIITGWVDGVQYLEYTTSAGTGQAVGFGLGGSSPYRVERFRVYTGRWPASFVTPAIVAVSGGSVFQGDTQAIAPAAGGSGVLTAVRFPSWAAFDNKLYITDGNSPLQVMDMMTREVAPISVSAGDEDADTLGLNRVCTAWRGRLVLAATANAPYNFIFSRAGNPTDFDYSQSDPAAAFAGNASVVGRIGQPILALIPFSEDQLMIAGDSNLWMVRGDPADGGSIDLITDALGIVGSHAWTKAPDGSVYFVGTGGFYRMSPAGVPESISTESYPQYFERINRGTHHITMAWDRDRQGAFIFVTPVNTGEATHLWYDARTGGFFPLQFPDNHGPLSVAVVDGPGPLDRITLIGCRDGYIRRLALGALSDDGAAIESYVLMGPFQLGDSRNDGIIGDVQLTYGEPIPGTTASDNWGVTAELRAGLSAYQVTEGTGYRRAVRNFGAMYSRMTGMVQKLRGAWGAVKLSDTSNDRYFSFETAAISIQPAGQTRR